MKTVTTGVIECYSVENVSVTYSVSVNYKGKTIRVQSLAYVSDTKALPVGTKVEVECNDDIVDWSTGWNRKVKILDGTIILLSEQKDEKEFAILVVLCFVLLFIYCLI